MRQLTPGGGEGGLSPSYVNRGTIESAKFPRDAEFKNAPRFTPSVFNLREVKDVLQERRGGGVLARKERCRVYTSGVGWSCKRSAMTSSRVSGTCTPGRASPAASRASVGCIWRCRGSRRRRYVSIAPVSSPFHPCPVLAILIAFLIAGHERPAGQRVYQRILCLGFCEIL